MLLSDRDLMAAIVDESLSIVPLDPDLIQPASIDVRLGDQFRVFTQSRATHIDPRDIPTDLTELTLWPGMPIGQLCVMRLTSPAERPYGTAGLGSRYQGQAGPTASAGVTS